MAVALQLPPQASDQPRVGQVRDQRHAPRQAEGGQLTGDQQGHEANTLYQYFGGKRAVLAALALDPGRLEDELVRLMESYIAALSANTGPSG